VGGDCAGVAIGVGVVGRGARVSSCDCVGAGGVRAVGCRGVIVLIVADVGDLNRARRG
jgi:hypothetical protein